MHRAFATLPCLDGRFGVLSLLQGNPPWFAGTFNTLSPLLPHASYLGWLRVYEELCGPQVSTYRLACRWFLGRQSTTQVARTAQT